MYSDLSNAVSKQYLDAVSAFEGWHQVALQLEDYRGGMHWKTVSGREYLYKTSDRRGNAKSMGPRSESTEGIHAEFTRRKADLREREAALRDTLDLQTRMNVAVRVGSVPVDVMRVCVELEQAQLLGKAIMVIGTNTMHAYGFLGSVRFDSDFMATMDVDLLRNHNLRLSLVATSEVSHAGLMGILKRADASYEIDNKQRFRARATSGFMVDLIRQTPIPPWRMEPDSFFENDLVATDIPNMKWLLSAPRITQPVVATNGRVFNMVVPDPRAFAAYKVWLSKVPDREPAKRPRDIAQAQAVVKLIQERLPHLDNWGALSGVPKELMEGAWGPGDVNSTSALQPPRDR